MGDSNRAYLAEHDGHRIEVEIRPASAFASTRIASLIIDNHRVEDLHYGPGRLSLRGWLENEGGKRATVVVRIRDPMFWFQRVTLEVDGVAIPMTKIY
jgi:hypothetical protein